MKRLFIILAMCSLAAGVVAQDLDTVTITDQLNTGSRGKNLNSGPNFGNAVPDGTDYLDYAGTDFSASVTTSARYINSWATGDPESPVVTVTSPMANPDRSGFTIPAIPANNRPGATGGSTAVLIADDGGFNALFFGESDDSDYYMQADVYCWNKSGAPSNETEFAGVVARAARDNDTSLTEYTYNADLAGSYGIFYDYQLREVKAVRWITENSPTDVEARLPTTYEQYGTTITLVSEGWHTMKVECKDSKIQFTFDGTVMATVTDTNLAYGRPGIYYREANVDDSLERQGIFDQIKAGPATLVSGIASWSIY